MDSPTSSLLSATEERELLRRLSEGDRIAPKELCLLYLDRLEVWLQARHHPRDPLLLRTAAEDAVLSLIKNPSACNLNHKDLLGYLCMAADGDCLNLVSKEARHHRRRQSWDSVENDPEGGNVTGRECDPALAAEREELRQLNREWLETASADWTQEERAVLWLMYQGERDDSAYLRALRIETLPRNDAQRTVKQTKGRILARLKREVKPHE